MADNSNKKYSGKTAHPLAKLKKRADVTVKELLAKLAIAEANIMTAIVRCQNPAYAKNQRDLYNKIRESYFKLCRQIDQALKSDVASAATDAYHQLEDELGSDGLVRWDEERAKRYWQYVAPEQSQSLAAVYTDKMAESAITSLRQALIETERQASIEGWTMNEKQKALQAKWASLASQADFQFVDKAGKGWEHARYLQMLTRTTAQRVYNDSYLDRVAENGIKLVRVTALGAPECEVCRAWQGVICSIDGTARGLPSIESAKAAGVFHPNCVCIHEAVIEEVDKTELAIQRKHPFTKDIRDLDAYEARKFAIDQERYERKGLSAEDARIAVNRDNLEAAIRNGLIRSDAREIVDGLTDTQVAALCPDGKTPRFEPLKKGDDTKIVRGSRGGVVHIGKDCTLEELTSLIDAYEVRRVKVKATTPQEKTPPPPPPPPPPPKLDFPETIEGSGMEVINDSPGGSTGAKIVKIGDAKFVLKQDTHVSAEHIRNEVEADNAYRRAGVLVPECRLYEENGKTYKLSRFIDGAQSLHDYMANATPDQKKAVIDKLKEGFPLDVVFANWDVLGTGQDNVLVDKDGNPWRIDNGSAFGFRAQGAKKKPEEWENRQFPDEWRTLRTSSINKGVYDGLTAAEIFEAYSKLDMEAIIKDLPENTRKALEKPLREMNELKARFTDFRRGDYIDSYTSEMLELTYDLCKAGMRERFPAEIANEHADKGWLRPSITDDDYSNEKVSTAISDKVMKAVISIKYHIQLGDYTPNEVSVVNALSTEAELEKIVKWDDNAAPLLRAIREIKKSKKDNFKTMADIHVESVALQLSKPTPQRENEDQSKCFAEFLEDFGNKNGVDINRAFRMFREQGGSSESPGSCTMKLFEMEAMGIDWKQPPKNVYIRDEFKSAIDEFKSNIKENKEEIEDYRKAYNLFKAGTQLLLENVKLPFKNDANRTVRLMRTGNFSTTYQLKLKEIDDAFAEGAHESFGSYHTVRFSGGDLIIRDLPYSRISSTYLTTNKNGGSLYAEDEENEFGANCIGLPICYVGETVKNISYSNFTNDVNEAEKKSGRKLSD